MQIPRALRLRRMMQNERLLLGHQILIPMVDIGLAQLAMHSAMETASCKDAEYMAKAVAEFYNTPISQLTIRGTSWKKIIFLCANI